MSARYDRGLFTLAAALVIAGSACAGNPAARHGTTTSSASSTRLSVKNEFGFPVTVQAIGSGATWSLGRVMPGFSRTFTLPESLIANGVVEFVVSGEGAAPFRSGPMQLTGGRVVDFKITRPLYASTAVVR
jgi:hypothetical protein